MNHCHISSMWWTWFPFSKPVESSPSSLLASSAVTIFHAQRHFFASFTFYIHTVSLLPMVGKLSHALFPFAGGFRNTGIVDHAMSKCSMSCDAMMRTSLSVNESKQSAGGGSWRNAADQKSSSWRAHQHKRWLHSVQCPCLHPIHIHYPMLVTCPQVVHLIDSCLFHSRNTLFVLLYVYGYG